MKRKPPMLDIPADINLGRWMFERPEEFHVINRHFAEQAAHRSTYGKRKAMHRAGSDYYSDKKYEKGGW